MLNCSTFKQMMNLRPCSNVVVYRTLAPFSLPWLAASFFVCESLSGYITDGLRQRKRCERSARIRQSKRESGFCCRETHQSTIQVVVPKFHQKQMGGRRRRRRKRRGNEKIRVYKSGKAEIIKAMEINRYRNK